MHSCAALASVLETTWDTEGPCDGEGAMLAGHERVVEATVKSLKPLVEELRRRRVLIGADLEL